MVLSVGLFVLALGSMLLYLVLTALLQPSALRAPRQKGVGPGVERTDPADGLAVARDYMMMLVTVVVLAGAMYVIISDVYDEGTEKWAFGAVGSLIGFWLKPKA